MRSIKDRADLILETIIGKEELKSLLINEDISIIKGGLYQVGKSTSDIYKVINFGYNDKSISDINHSQILIPSSSFNKPFHSIENDEDKYLQVYIYWKYKNLDKNDSITNHNNFVNCNEKILMAIYKLFKKDSIFEIRYDFEEFNGVATRFYKFGFRERNSNSQWRFTASDFDISKNDCFWNSFADFICSRYAIYVSSENLKNDYSNIIDNLPEQIPFKEFEERYYKIKY